MPLAPSLYQLLKFLWHHITRRQQCQLFLLLILMIIVAFAEMLSIGAIFPFLAVLTSPDRVFHHSLGKLLADVLNVSTSKQLMLPITILFAIAIIIAGGMRLLLVWVQAKVSQAIGGDLTLDAYRRTLYQPYMVHTRRNSSETLNGIYGKTGIISTSIILPLLTIISTLTLMTAIIVTLVAIDPFVSLTALVGFALIYAGVIKLTHRKLLRNSRQVAYEGDKVVRSLQEGLGGIRDVLLDHTQNVYCNIFRRADVSMRKAQTSSAFIAQSPRFVVEALGMLLIAFLAYNLAVTMDNGITEAIPVLGALALGAQRILPLLQQCFQSWSAIRSNQALLADALMFLKQPLPDNALHSSVERLPFQSSLKLDNVWFRYGAETDWVLRDISLDIQRGAKVGFVGVTGGGKSTLLDIVMGLLHPTSGLLKIDDVIVNDQNLSRWHAHIAHVPQSVFLSDSSIASNIAFGIPAEEIDITRVREAADRAQLLNTIESWPEGFETRVGERGVRLSGGQRQRIGIARALYKRADVLIFDEATSALDSETEYAVMDAVRTLGSDITVLIIAHRLNTLSNCDVIIKLNEGRIAYSCSYQELLSKP